MLLLKDIKMLYEISRKQYFINRIDEPRLCWQNNNISVHIDKGINFLHISHDLGCLNKDINFSVSYLSNTKNSPATDLLSPNNLPHKMKNLEVNQLILDPGFWPFNSELTNESANISHIEWSPLDAFGNREKVIAIVNSAGNVELFICQRLQWNSLLNLSSEIRKHYESQQKISIKSFSNLQNIVFALESSAIVWGSLCENNSCFFVTAQRNGTLLLWKIQFDLLSTHAMLLCETQTDIGEISTIQWIQKDNNSFILLCANDFGQIYAYDFKIEENNILLINNVCIWKYKDRMVSKYIKFEVYNDKVIVLCSKHRHLLVQLIDFNCNVLSENISNINDYRITSLIKNIDGFYLSTANCKIYKINVNVANNEIKNINFSSIDVKESYSNYELYSIASSTNNLLWIFAMVDRKVMFRKVNFKLELMILVRDDQEPSEISLLLNNPSRKLTHYWDCIELLRYKVVKTKFLPSIDYQNLYTEGNTDIYKLKVFFVLLRLYNNLEKLKKNFYKDLLPETSEEIVKEKIHVLYAIQNIIELYEIGMKRGDLNNFELHSFDAMKKCLEHYFKKNNRSLSAVLPENLLSFKKVDFKYICQCCDKELVGFSCEDGHLNMICSLSFTPIECEEYLACSNCQAIAHLELYSYNPLCILCDLPLSKLHVPPS